MRKLYLLALAGLMVLGAMMPVMAKDIYTEFKDGVLTFYYDDNMSDKTLHPGTVEPFVQVLDKDDPFTRYVGYTDAITKAVIDPSMKDAPLTSTCFMFHGGYDGYGMYPLTAMAEITGLENLNAEAITNMAYMFMMCPALKSVNLSGLNTCNVTDMSMLFSQSTALTEVNLSGLNVTNVKNMEEMFSFCSNLKSVNFGTNFNTGKVENMRAMFAACSHLTSLDLSSFNTASVKSMSDMFFQCTDLASLDISRFNTSEVKSMHEMFIGCSSLRILDLTSFDVSGVTNMEDMFSGCTKLESIFYDGDWSTSAPIGVTSSNMFKDCTSLQGGEGTVYDDAKTDIEYARTDEGTGKPGYFSAFTITDEDRAAAKVVVDLIDAIGKVTYTDECKTKIDAARNAYKDLTLAQKSLVTNLSTLEAAELLYQRKKDAADGIKSVYTEYKDGVLTFYYDANIGNEELHPGIVESYIEVTNPATWICRYSGYEELVTKAVFDPSMKEAPLKSTMYLFFGSYGGMYGINALSKMQTVEGLENLNAEALTDMSYMFCYCAGLKSVDLSGLNTVNVTNMDYMFGICQSLESVNMSGMNVSSVTSMEDMFRDCINLTSVDFGSSFNTASVTNMKEMFSGCESLPSLHLPFNTAKVTTMVDMFDACYVLKSVTFGEDFTTENVADMSFMFHDCKALETIDISGFRTNASQVRRYMFDNCSSLTTIYCNDDLNKFLYDGFNNANMFDGCTSLVGGNGTKFTDSYLNLDYARPDYGEGFPGYFTATNEVASYVLIDGFLCILDEPTETAKIMGCNNYAKNPLVIPESVSPVYGGTEYTVTAIGKEAFRKASNFYLTLPATFNLIEEGAFAYGNVEVIHSKSPVPPTIQKDAFDFSKTKECYVYAEYLEDYKAADVWKDFTDHNAIDTDHDDDANAVIALINAIGPVVYTDECKTKIEDVRKAFDALADYERRLVTNYNKLDAAEARYQALKDHLDPTEQVIDGIRYYLDGIPLTAQVIELDGGDKYEGDIVIPEQVDYWEYTYTVTSISDIAFINCPELLSVSLPKTINWIEPNAFLSNPKLTAINVAADNADYSSLDGVLFNKDKKELIVYPTGKEGAYTVPDGVETIIDDAFAGNTHLTAVTLPASLGEIASLAFENCTGLTSITSLATTAPHAGSQAFDNVPKSIPVYVPKDGLASYKAEDEWKDFDNFITLEDKAAAEAVVAKIEAIGTVEYTDECKAKIDDARKDYDALSEGAKKVITAEQLKVLTDAEAEYAALKKKAEDDKAAADAVVDKINAIGTVNTSDYCKGLIDDARGAYNALTEDQKALITAEQLKVLTDAEAKYAELKKAQADLEAAVVVIGKISDIGSVSCTKECKDLIDAARAAYDALTEDQKALVDNYDKLTDAEATYAELKEAAEKAAAELAKAKAELNAVIAELEYLQKFAHDNGLTDIEAILGFSISTAKAVADNEGATIEQVQGATTVAQNTLSSAEDSLLTIAKTRFKAELDKLLKPEDSDACKQIIADAKDDVDAITLDKEKSAAENIAAVQKAGEDILNKAKADLEAQRKSEETPTGMESIQHSAISSQKVLRDGKVYILIGDRMYDATGRLVK